MTMIGPTPGHRVKQLEVRTRKANGRNRSRLVEVAIKEPVVTTPGYSKSLPSASPSKHSRSPSKHHLPGEEGVENAYDMNDPPVEPFPMPHKKVCCYSMAGHTTSYQKFRCRMTISANGYNKRRTSSTSCWSWKPPLCHGCVRFAKGMGCTDARIACISRFFVPIAAA